RRPAGEPRAPGRSSDARPAPSLPCPPRRLPPPRWAPPPCRRLPLGKAHPLRFRLPPRKPLPSRWPHRDPPPPAARPPPPRARCPVCKTIPSLVSHQVTSSQPTRPGLQPARPVPCPFNHLIVTIRKLGTRVKSRTTKNLPSGGMMSETAVEIPGYVAGTWTID